MDFLFDLTSPWHIRLTNLTMVVLAVSYLLAFLHRGARGHWLQAYSKGKLGKVLTLSAVICTPIYLFGVLFRMDPAPPIHGEWWHLALLPAILYVGIIPYYAAGLTLSVIINKKKPEQPPQSLIVDVNGKPYSS